MKKIVTFRIVLLVVVTLLVVLGLLATMLLMLTGNFDLRQMAWSGLSVNEELLSSVGQQDQNISDQEIDRTIIPGSQEETFYKWLKDYPDADQIKISIPDFLLSGIAFNAYAADLDQTKVYIYLENVPQITGFYTHLWIEKKDGSFVHLTQAQRINDFPPESFLVGEISGSLDLFKTAHLSFEGSQLGDKPLTPFMSIDF